MESLDVTIFCMSLHKEEQTLRTMKKLFFFIVVICVLGLAGCNNNPKQSPIMNEAEIEEWRQKEHPDEIAVETSFTPTVDIKYIQNITLEELVIQNFYRKSFSELREENPGFTYDDYRKYLAERALQAYHAFPNIGTIELKFVPVTSNLAKAYCLQAPHSFEEHNLDYVNNVCNEYRAAREKEKEQKAQENWEKYLE